MWRWDRRWSVGALGTRTKAFSHNEIVISATYIHEKRLEYRYSSRSVCFYPQEYILLKSERYADHRILYTGIFFLKTNCITLIKVVHISTDLINVLFTLCNSSAVTTTVTGRTLSVSWYHTHNTIITWPVSGGRCMTRSSVPGVSAVLSAPRPRPALQLCI